MPETHLDVAVPGHEIPVRIHKIIPQGFRAEVGHLIRRGRQYLGIPNWLDHTTTGVTWMGLFRTWLMGWPLNRGVPESLSRLLAPGGFFCDVSDSAPILIERMSGRLWMTYSEWVRSLSRERYDQYTLWRGASAFPRPGFQRFWMMNPTKVTTFAGLRDLYNGPRRPPDGTTPLVRLPFVFCEMEFDNPQDAIAFTRWAAYLPDREFRELAYLETANNRNGMNGVFHIDHRTTLDEPDYRFRDFERETWTPTGVTAGDLGTTRTFLGGQEWTLNTPRFRGIETPPPPGRGLRPATGFYNETAPRIPGTGFTDGVNTPTVTGTTGALWVAPRRTTPNPPTETVMLLELFLMTRIDPTDTVAAGAEVIHYKGNRYIVNAEESGSEAEALEGGAAYAAVWAATKTAFHDAANRARDAAER